MDRFSSFTVIFFFGVLSLLAGCGRAADRGEAVLAMVGDQKITLSDFNERIANLPERYRRIVKKRKGEYLEELINDTMLYREAVRRNMHKDREVQKVIEEARKKILIAKLLKEEVDDAIEITEEEISDFYAEHKNMYMTPEILRVSHILTSSREDAENIQKELDEGADFADMARAKSVDPTAQRGGDIGYFPVGQLMPEFEDACAGLGINEISDIVKTKLGYHIIKLTDRRKPELRPIEQVAADIRSRLHTMKRRLIFNELLDRLRKETTVEINEEALSEHE